MIRKAITVTANDASGNEQALTVQLENTERRRSAHGWMRRLSTINAALQAFERRGLPRNRCGKRSERGWRTNQISSVPPAFQRSIGSDANGTGLQSQGINFAHRSPGPGSSADISNVTTANRRRERTGRGGDQARRRTGGDRRGWRTSSTTPSTWRRHSSPTSAAAESADFAMPIWPRIREPDQGLIQLQAGIAALAQANSAPPANSHPA